MPTTPSPLDALRWRYATKSFDPGRTIPSGIWEQLAESLVLTPSSYGLQPWKFLVLTDKAIRESLVPHSWGQRQVADCSHLVVFAVKKALTEGDVDHHLARISEVQGRTPDSLAPLRSVIVNDVVTGPRSREATDWARRQAYIALGQFLLAAALLDVDTCPMEGFLADRYDEVLGLTPRGLTTAVICPAGYRSATDKYATLPKVRFPANEVIEYH